MSEQHDAVLTFWHRVPANCLSYKIIVSNNSLREVLVKFFFIHFRFLYCIDKQSNNQPNLKRLQGDGISKASITVTNNSININECFQKCLEIQRKKYADINAFTTTITGTPPRFALERDLSVDGCVCHQGYTNINSSLTCFLSIRKSKWIFFYLIIHGFLLRKHAI